MSTRAKIIVKDEYDTLYFYRHSDGYPEGVKPTLTVLLDMLKKGLVRNNVGQFAGWLILIGAWEYDTLPKRIKEKYDVENSEFKPDLKNNGFDWKVGAYEPITSDHVDFAYQYIFNLKTKEIKVYEYNDKLIETWK